LLLEVISKELESTRIHSATEMSVTGGSTTAVMKRDFTPHRPPLLIRYNQLDIEKVGALPDVPDSFAYKFKFVPPPGPLTPGET
jgi:hypothetical protein